MPPRAFWPPKPSTPGKGGDHDRCTTSADSDWQLEQRVAFLYDRSILQPDMVEGIPARHIGQNYRVPLLQSLQHLDGVHRCPTDPYRHAHGILAATTQLEEADRAVLLS